MDKNNQNIGQPFDKKSLKVSKRSALPPFLALDVMRKATAVSYTHLTLPTT